VTGIKLPKLSLGKDLTTYADMAYHVVRSLIIENKLKPDDQLSENDLAQSFGVSRAPVRKALDHLAADGLIRILPKKGSFVEKISVKRLMEICFMRAAIESAAIRHSSELDEESFEKILKKLARNLEKQEKTLDLKGCYAGAKFLKLDDDFHATLCELSGTSMAWETIDSLKANMDRIRYFTFIGKISELKDLIEEHTEIYKAISEKKSGEACELLKRHLYEIGSTYKEVMAKNSEWFLQ
jgi:DNA-binding GntR family transcriptional regulator